MRRDCETVADFNKLFIHSLTSFYGEVINHRVKMTSFEDESGVIELQLGSSKSEAGVTQIESCVAHLEVGVAHLVLGVAGSPFQTNLFF